jgi:WD40 repeat protein
MDDSSANSAETGDRKPSWPKWSLLISALLWLLAWQAIVWFVPVQPRAVLRTSERLMGFSSDGKTLVTMDEQDAGHYPRVLYHLWDANTGQDLGGFGHEEENNLPTIVYSSHRGWLDEPLTRQVGKAAFLSNVSNVYTLYDLTVRREREAAQESGEDPHDDGPIDVCISTNGRTFAYSACKEGEGDLVVIDVATGKVRCHVKGGEFRGIVLSPDSNRLATIEIELCGDDIEPVDVKLIVLDITTGKMQTVLDRIERADFIAFSPDGTKLAALGRVWDAATGKEIASFRSEGFPEFLPDGKLALCNRDGLGFCDLASGQEFALADIHPQFGPEMCLGYYRALFAAPHTPLLAVRRWHPSGSNPFLQKYASMLGITWFDQKTVDEELAFVDTGTGEIVASIPCSKLIEPLISPEGKSFALYAYENNESFIELWDIPPRRPLGWVLGLLAIPGVVTAVTLWRWRKA